MADLTTAAPAAAPGAQTQEQQLQAFLDQSKQQTAAELQHGQEKQAALDPIYGAAQKAIQSPVPQPPAPVQMPQVDKSPIVDPKGFEQFSLGMIGLALIGGAASKSHWMRATATLDGAMKGYLQGSQDVAAQKKEQFDKEYKLAVDKETQQNKEYLDTLSQRDKSIKDILAEAEVVAAKYGMVDAQDAIRRRDLDSSFKVVAQRQTALDNLNQKHDTLEQQFKDKQISRLDKLLQQQQITPDQHDQAVSDIQEGKTPTLKTGTGGMSKEAVEIPGEKYFETGKMEALGMNNPTARNQIIQYATDKAKRLNMTPSEVVAAWASRPGDMAALSQIDKQQVAIGGFEGTAQKNLDMLNSMSDKLPRTSYSQMVNSWIQWGRVKSGDPQADAFNAALEETLSEYSKVMGGGYGAGSSTEGAQARAHSLLAGGTTPEQMKAVSETMRQTMKNRTQSIEEQKQAVLNRIKGTGGGSGGGTVLKFDAQGNQIQ
jgi:hypothetical protein